MAAEEDGVFSSDMARALKETLEEIVTIDEALERSITTSWMQFMGARTLLYVDGKHVDATAAVPFGDCPCGRARAGCEYHDPRLQP